MGGDYSHYVYFPWMKHYSLAKKRCDKKYKQCYKHETKFLLSPLDIKKIWFRDKASIMDSASLDRIDVTKNYTYDNCRFIELKLNRQLPRRKPLNSKNRFKGVYWQKDHKKFRCVAVAFGKDIHIGYFDNEEEAAKAYNECVSRLFNQKILINKV